MKIAIVAGPYMPIPPKKYGGTELVIHFIIKGLLELGHEPILLAPGDSVVDCELIPICEKSINFPKSMQEKEEFDKQIAIALDNTARELTRLRSRVDIIHSHNFDLMDFQDFPNLTTIHGKIDLPQLDYYSKRHNLYYVSISKNQQGCCPDLQYAGVVYNGEDPSQFPFVSEPEDYLCFMGRFDSEKSPHLAIELALNLNMKLKMAGKIDFQGEEYFKEKIEPYLDNPLIEFLGELGFDDKVELISKAKCNLHPITGFREPFGLSVLEAAYCGTPTMAISRGSMPELIEEGRTGLLVEDFVEGYHHIEECFKMDRAYIATRSRMLFNYKTMVRQYLFAYEKVIEIFKQNAKEEDILTSILSGAQEGMQSIWQSQNQPN
jgi:glycosyltransferase involved in cell wall biosynthesis